MVNKKKKIVKKSEFEKFARLILDRNFVSKLLLMQGVFFTAIIFGYLVDYLMNISGFVKGLLILIAYLIESCYLLLVWEDNKRFKRILIGYSIVACSIIAIFLIKGL